MLKLFTLTVCNVRRLLRTKTVSAPLSIVAAAFVGMEAACNIGSALSSLGPLAAAAVACIVQAARDASQGFTLGVVSAGVPRVMLHLSRLLSIAIVFLTLHLARLALLHIL